MRKRSAVVAVLLVIAALGVAVPAKSLSLKPTGAARDVIVEFTAPPTLGDFAWLKSQGLTGPFVRYNIVNAIAASATPGAVANLRKAPRVKSVEYDQVLDLTLDRAVKVGRVAPLRIATFMLNGVPKTGGFTGRGVTVATLDSGIDGTHPDLKHKALANLAKEPAVTVGNFVMLGRSVLNDLAAQLSGVAVNENFPLGENSLLDNLIEANTTAIPAINSDNGGHGTHVAGIIAGRGYNSDGKYVGVAPSAQLVGLSAGEVVPVTRALAAMDWLHQHHAEYGIRVFNNSWGGGASTDNPSSLVRNAAERLVNEDKIAVVFAAGNNGGDGSEVQTAYNSNSPSVISVANYFDRTGWLDDSSSRGAKNDPSTWPDLAAPGTHIISTAMTGGAITYYGTTQDALVSTITADGDPIVVPVPKPNVTELAGPEVPGFGPTSIVAGDYASMTGTSMAAPFVSGVVALLLEANPSLTPFQLRDILIATANMPPGRTYAEDGYAIGHGVVDAAEAVAVALRMREGADLPTALSTASLDLVTKPARLNFTTTGVTDNTIPLFPPPAPPFSGEGNVYHAGAVNPFGLTGNQTVISGEPVELAARTITSHAPASPLTVGNFTVDFTLLSGNTVVAGPFTGVNAADEEAWQSTYDWTIPQGLPAGTYRFTGRLTYNGAQTYALFDIPVRVLRAPATPTLP